MGKLTLGKTWKLCLQMWKWIARQIRAGSKKDIDILKQEWLKDNWAGGDIMNECFFCEYGITHIKYVKTDGSGCCDCPAVFVDRQFHCINKKYAWDNHPIAFYNKLVQLNKKRLSK